MSTYDALRHFADSWVLLAMTLFFIGVVLRSVTAKTEQIAAAAAIPMNEMSPADFAGAAPGDRPTAAPETKTETETESCCGDCANKGACAAEKAKTLSFGDAA